MKHKLSIFVIIFIIFSLVLIQKNFGLSLLEIGQVFLIKNTFYVATEAGCRSANFLNRNIRLVSNLILTSDFSSKVRFESNGHYIDGKFQFKPIKEFLGTPGCFGPDLQVSGLYFSKPEWWNVKAGDGVTECSVEINKAINALAGGEICFSNGMTYIVNTGSVFCKGGIRYSGGGTIKAHSQDYLGLPNNKVYPLFHFLDKQRYIIIEDLIFDGNAAFQTNRVRFSDKTTGLDGIYFGACDKVEIRRNSFYNFRGTGFNMSSEPKQKWLVEENRFDRCEDGFACFRYINDLLVKNNIGSNAGVLPLDAENPPLQGNGFLIGSCSNSRVISNLLSNISRKGLYFTSKNPGAGHDNISKNNYIENTYWTGIDISHNSHRVVSFNDTVRNVGFFGDGISITGKKDQPAIDCKIEGSDIETTGQHGIQVVYCSNPLIKNNKIKHAGLAGVAEEKSHNVQIIGSKIENSAKYGIRSGSNGTQIKNNSLSKSDLHSIYIFGNNSVIERNNINESISGTGINVKGGKGIIIRNNTLKNLQIGITFSPNGELGIPEIIDNIFDSCKIRGISWNETNKLKGILIQGNTFKNTKEMMKSQIFKTGSPIFYHYNQGQISVYRDFSELLQLNHCE